jgi:release factor glutamine methyltransferase
MRIDALLAASGLPRSEALRLLAHATGRSRERLIADSHEMLPSVLAEAFAALARRRAAGEPLAYLVGEREFFGRSFVVDATVLIPRHETELLVERALAAIDSVAVDPAAIDPPAIGSTAVDATSDRRRLRVLDLGTGSGIVAITLALERPDIEVVATDASDEALRIASHNAARLGASIVCVSGDWFGALAVGMDRFDVVVANPPYIAADDRHLDEGDLRFEPIAALTDGADGLQALRQIVADAPSWLARGGVLAVEHGHDQATAVRTLFDAAGFADVACARDLAGIERVTSGRLATHHAGRRERRGARL